MNMASLDMRTRDAIPAIELTLSVRVDDAAALWAAAAARLLASPGMTIEDVLDTIGPREDPCLADCILVLSALDVPAGCSPMGLDARELPRPARPLAAIPVMAVAAAR